MFALGSATAVLHDVTSLGDVNALRGRAKTPKSPSTRFQRKMDYHITRALGGNATSCDVSRGARPSTPATQKWSTNAVPSFRTTYTRTRQNHTFRRTISKRQAYQPETSVSDGSADSVPTKESDETKTNFSPDDAMKTIEARSLEESIQSRAVQRALAGAVAKSLAKSGSNRLSEQESSAIGQKVVNALRSHTKRRRVGRHVEYMFVRSALAATGFFVVMGVVASLSLSGLLFTMGVREVLFDAVAAWIRFSPVELVTAAVGALDRFLLGMVCVIFGVGAFEVFLARKKNEQNGSFEPRNASLRRLRWLHIESVDDLEQQVSGIVVAVLVVNILELSLHMTFSKPIDLVFASMAPLACAGALALLHWSASGSQSDVAKKIKKKIARRIGLESDNEGHGAVSHAEDEVVASAAR